MCACVCHSLPLPGLSSLWVCCASCQDRLVRRGRVPNVTFESYIESRKLSVPRARPARTASRPANSLRRSEHGRVPNVAFESNMQQGYRSVQRPLFAVGKRARPGKALKHPQGTVFSAEALSRPARPAFLLPFCCRRTPLVGSRCGQRSGFFPFPLCCRRKRGKRSFCGWPLPLDRFSAESYAQQVFEHSRPAQLRGSWCSGITPAQHARGPCAPASVTVCLSLVFHPFGFAVRLAKTGWYAAAGCRTSLLNPI